MKNMEKWFEDSGDKSSLKPSDAKYDFLKHLGYTSISEFLRHTAGKVAIFTLIGGVGSRWRASVVDAANKKLVDEYGVTDPEKARSLVEVPNFLDLKQENIPLLSYTFFSTRHLVANGAKNYVIYNRAEDLTQIRQSAGVNGLLSTPYFYQERLVDGKLPGHAGALSPYLDKIGQTDYIITHFGSDLNAQQTIELSLLGAYALNSKKDCAVLLPSYPTLTPRYPTSIDQEGKVRVLGHEKHSLIVPTFNGVTRMVATNVGVRIYRSDYLLKAIPELQREIGTKNEFALDNIDQHFANQGLAYHLPVASERETRSAKLINDIPALVAGFKGLYQ